MVCLIAKFKVIFTVCIFLTNSIHGLESDNNLSDEEVEPRKNIFAALKENIIDKTINKTEDLTESIVDKAVNTTKNLFTVNGQTLNCFGIPSTSLSNVVEKLLTQTTKAEDVRFYFYSREQPDEAVVRASDDVDIDAISYKADRTTVVITHGFMSSGKEDWVRNMKDAFLEMGDFNVIIVDWQSGSNTWNYVSASISTRIVGQQIASLLEKIKEKVSERQPDLKICGRLHFVGHSLGSHISAHAAHLVNESNEVAEKRWIVARITGLDPAQPCFNTADKSLKLDRDDAQFVDVIHTNARHILLLGLGLHEQLGSIDFYPNGGEIQLGCDTIDISKWKFILLPMKIIKSAICSHGRSYELFTDSIKASVSGACTYVGHKWDQKYENISTLLKNDCQEDSCPELGINSINYLAKDGVFFVPTSDSPYYCDISEDSMKELQNQLSSQQSANYNKITQTIGKFVG